MTDRTPLVSVVVPTRNRPELLARCLRALIGQTLGGDSYEVVVCDDGPAEAVRVVVQKLADLAQGRPMLRYIPVTATQGPAGARNAGWRAARSAVIAFTDDDTIPEPYWLRAGLDAMASPGVQAVAGRIVMPLPERPTDMDLDAAGLASAEFATANCFVMRDALERVGGFDERYTLAWREDSDLHFALIDTGQRIVSAPGAKVVHPLRRTHFGAGLHMQRKVMFDVLLYRKFPDLYRQHIRKGPPWFYLLVCGSFLLALVNFLAGDRPSAAAAALLWALLSLLFFFRRLRRSAFTLRNIAELAVTSVFIPLLSVFWRLVGAVRFGLAVP
ncbi:MAG TPA: glycosyltransferase [Candidimonas sp.]|nr:glycosyltransferase [Candidimonas sp.]